MEILASKRFVDKFDRCVRKMLILDEVRQLSQELESLRAGGALRSGNIKNLVGAIRERGKKSGFALDEWRMTLRARIVFDSSSDALRLVDFADDDTHTVVEALDRLKPGELASILNSVEPLPALMAELWVRLNQEVSDEEFFEVVSGDSHLNMDRSIFTEEHFNEWIKFLDTPQEKIRDEILIALSGDLGHEVHFILGGPGTGKTMVLLDLASCYPLYADDEPNLILPAGVKHYVRAHDPYIPGLDGNPSAPVWLLDDPETFEIMVQRINEARVRKAKIVVAIDPSQWHKRRTIEKFHAYLEGHQHHRYELSKGYRQGGGVGGPAVQLVRNFLTKSSAFAADARFDLERTQASLWEELCLNQIEFADQSGILRIYDDSEDVLADLMSELREMQTFENYRNWPKTLVGWTSKTNLPPGVEKVLAEVQKEYPGFQYRKRAYQQVMEVRGTEYDSAVLFVTAEQWGYLRSGIRGAGTEAWELVTPLLTFLTRAENRLAIFVVGYDWPKA